MSYARRVAYNTVIQVLGRVFTTITSLITVSLLNSSLRPEGWGGYVAVTTYLGFFAVIADMGLNLLYLREISRRPENEQEITSKFLGFRLITAALVLLVVAPLIGGIIPAYSGYGVAIMLLAVGQFILALNQMMVTVVQARLLMDRAMLSDLVGRIIILAGTVLVVTKLPQESRLGGAIAFTVLGNALNLLVNFFFTRQFVRFRPRFAWSEWPGIFRQVLPMGALAVLGMIHFKADSVLLTLYRPAVEVGVYGNAYKVLEILITLPGMFVGGLFPEMNQLIQRGKDHLVPLFQKAFDLLVFAVLPVVAGIILIAPQLISILTRNFVTESAQSLQILALAMVPLYLGTLMTHTLLTVERQKSLTLIELVATLLNVGLNIYLIPRYTYFGAATATVITEVLSTIITTWLVIRAIGYLPRLRTLWPGIAGLVCMFAVFQVVQWAAGGAWDGAYYQWSRLQEVGMLVGVMIAGTLAYLAPFFLFRCFPPVVQERLRVRGKIVVDDD